MHTKEILARIREIYEVYSFDKKYVLYETNAQRLFLAHTTNGPPKYVPIYLITKYMHFYYIK